jgi:HPt (histidine-containing phosphotransfer) domain-containing protein
MTDPEVLDAPTIARLRQLAADTQRDGEDVLGELFSLYEKDARARVVAIATAVQAGELAAAGAVAHALKGASANVGAVQVRARCADVEAAAKAGDRAGAAAHAARMAPEVEAALAALASALRAP